MSPVTKKEVAKAARLLLIGLVTQPVVWALVQSWAVRLPLVAAAIPAIEVAVMRLFKPAQVAAVPATPTPAAPADPPPAKG